MPLIFALGFVFGLALGTGLGYFKLGQQQKEEKAKQEHQPSPSAATAAPPSPAPTATQPQTPNPSSVAPPAPKPEPAVSPVGIARPETLETPKTEPAGRAAISQSEPVKPAPVKTPVPTASNLAPSTPEDLAQQITAWGASGKADNVAPLLKCAYSKESNIRLLTAEALGEIAGTMGRKVSFQRAMPTLRKLLSDPSPDVRQAAAQAVSNLKSEEAIPLLNQAARDPSLKVSQVAKATLKQYRYYRPSKPVSKAPSKQQFPAEKK